jgi:hypothetical protein
MAFPPLCLHRRDYRLPPRLAAEMVNGTRTVLPVALIMPLPSQHPARWA